MEWPADFDREATIERFGALTAELEREFGCKCDADAWPDVQDASYFGRLVIPARATATGGDVVVVVSNHWPLAVYALENPGVYGAAELDALLDPLDKERVERVLLGAGHVIVPEALLWTAYEGSSVGVSTWWIRFFDYF